MWYRLAMQIPNGRWMWLDGCTPTTRIEDIDTYLKDPYYSTMREKLWLFETDDINKFNALLLAKNGSMPASAEYPERLELENQAGGDHDQPYVFAAPTNGVETSWLVWLLARYQRGELADDTTPEP